MLSLRSKTQNKPLLGTLTIRMKKLLKYSLLCVFVFALVVFGYTSSYYIIEIREHRDNLDLLSQNYDLSQSNPRSLIISIQRFTRYNLDWYANDLGGSLIENRRDYRGYWHLVGMHWYFWLKVIYSREERESIWLSMVYSRAGLGADIAAYHHFSKSLSELTCAEINELGVYITRPYQTSSGRIKVESFISENGGYQPCI